MSIEYKHAAIIEYLIKEYLESTIFTSIRGNRTHFHYLIIWIDIFADSDKSSSFSQFMYIDFRFYENTSIIFCFTNRVVPNLLGALLSVAAHHPRLRRRIPPHPQWTVLGAPWGGMLEVTTEPLPLLWPHPRSHRSPHSTDLDLIVTLFRPQGYQVHVMENLNMCKPYINEVWFKVETEFM